MRSQRPTEPAPLTGPQAHYMAQRLMRLMWLLAIILGLILVSLVVK